MGAVVPGGYGPGGGMVLEGVWSWRGYGPGGGIVPGGYGAGDGPGEGAWPREYWGYGPKGV